ncbi:MAG TPA: DUF3786 domain-containing protein [Desulfobacteria bacterium]|nr:DUF3786 domain-containing protein [Desulfobacteria bacterium]
MNKNYMNLDVTYDYAVNKLSMKEPAEIARNSEVDYDANTKTFTVPYMGDQYIVSFPDGAVSLKDKAGEVDIKVRILILHYLITANGAPLQNKWISFKELPDGAIYIDPFTRRTINPMVKTFAEKQDLFFQLAETVGARKESLGDTSLTINVFPRVPITYVLYSADDEFPASGNVLFDGSAPNYLPTEDYAIAASFVIYQFAALAGQNK